MKLYLLLSILLVSFIEQINGTILVDISKVINQAWASIVTAVRHPERPSSGFHSKHKPNHAREGSKMLIKFGPAHAHTEEFRKPNNISNSSTKFYSIILPTMNNSKLATAFLPTLNNSKLTITFQPALNNSKLTIAFLPALKNSILTTTFLPTLKSTKLYDTFLPGLNNSKLTTTIVPTGNSSKLTTNFLPALNNLKLTAAFVSTVNNSILTTIFPPSLNITVPANRRNAYHASRMEHTYDEQDNEDRKEACNRTWQARGRI